MAVVAFHELLDREPLGGIPKAKHLGNGALVIKQQAVFGTACEHMQGVAHLPKKRLALAENAQLRVIHKAVGDNIGVLLGAEVTLSHPANHLDIPQATGGAFEVGLQVVLGVVVAVVASNLLLPLGFKKAVGGPQVRGAQALAHLLTQTFRPGNEARLQQVGNHCDVCFGFPLAVVERANAVANLQADIPEEGDKSAQRLPVGGIVVVLKQQEQINIRMGMQFTTPVAAHGHQRNAVIGPSMLRPGNGEKLVEIPRPTAYQVANIATGAKAFIQACLDFPQRGFKRGDRRARPGKLGAKQVEIEKRRVRLEPVVVKKHQAFRKLKSSSLRAVSTSTPVSVTSRVCSHWAERLRSLVTAVQPSRSTLVL